MFKAYRKSQEIQLNWIHNHPFQFVALNAALIVVGIGYFEYMDRREIRKLNNEYPK
ncbi:MAG TPA: hypothetical protein VM715_13915 [Candidatus Acidoferrum sp.]|nr:hypothetical protein [Candidatus Acidoferrum sp.]